MNNEEWYKNELFIRKVVHDSISGKGSMRTFLE
jgi:hypothetical protein